MSDSYLFTGTTSAGDAGNLEVSTTRLMTRKLGILETSSFASGLAVGNGGNLTINAKESVDLSGGSGDNPFTVPGLFADTRDGKSGNLTVNTGRLIVRDGDRIDASTFGIGDAGSVAINAGDTVSFDGQSTNGISSGAFSTVAQGAVGNSGGINIKTGSLFVKVLYWIPAHRDGGMQGM